MLAAGAAVAVALLGSDVALITVGHAAQSDAQADSFSIYNGRVAAAADREQVGTEVDVGFDGGAVNNYYPMARVDVATAGTNAAASPADTGPFAQAVFAGQNVTQPQYVYAQYPGDQNPPAYSAGPATASASVTPASGTASATYGAVGNTASSPLSSADGSDGGTASVTSFFDTSLGFVTVGDSRVHHASYGAGMLVLEDVHVTVKVSSLGAGAFSKSISVTVGGATVNANGTAIPVTIDQNGVTVAQQNAPVDQVQSVSNTINQELQQAGITVHTVAPQVVQQGPNLHVEAEGVVVDVLQVGTPPGVPHQFVRHTLGEVVLDNEAVLAPPAPDLGAVTGSADLGSTTTEAPVSGSTEVSTSGGSVAVQTPQVVPPTTPKVVRLRPVRAPAASLSGVLTEPRANWLLLAYLAWQALMFALAGALYLHRLGQRTVR